MTDTSVPTYGESEWLIRRGDQQFIAPDFDAVKAWFGEGRLAKTDLIYHPSLGDQWREAGSLLMEDNQTAPTSQPRPTTTSLPKPLLVAGIGCAALISLVVGVMVFSVIAAPSDTFQATVLEADGNGSSAFTTVTIKNISSKPVENAAVHAWWSDGRHTRSEPQAVSLNPGEEVTVRFSAVLGVSDRANVADVNTGSFTGDVAEISRRQKETLRRFESATRSPGFSAKASSGETLWIKTIRP